MGSKGSCEGKMTDLGGVESAEWMAECKRVRWAALVYARNELE